LDETGIYFVLRTVAKGAGSYLGNDSVANGSTHNTPTGLGAGATAFTVPTAAATISGTLPVGGPLDVRTATLTTLLGGGTTTAERTAVADMIAPQFIETDVVVKSFQLGVLADLRSSLYNPDPNRLPAISNGAAITVVQDDGNTAFTAALTVISNAQLGVPGAGQVTITGTNLGNAERTLSTTVKFLDASNVPGQMLPVLLHQKSIVAAGGSVNPTSIVIPAALVPTWAVATTTKVQVQYTSLASAQFALV
jgi:hypothetical protein